LTQSRGHLLRALAHAGLPSIAIILFVAVAFGARAASVPNWKRGTWSRSANRNRHSALPTYINSINPLANEHDGFLVLSKLGNLIRTDPPSGSTPIPRSNRSRNLETAPDPATTNSVASSGF